MLQKREELGAAFRKTTSVVMSRSIKAIRIRGKIKPQKCQNSIIANLINLLAVIHILGSYMQNLWFGTPN
jgi:hypothetical protein